MSWRDRIVNAVLGGKVGGPTERGIMAYHSSPHDFERFDPSKLRTGEGGNMYGAGTYLAENPAVSGRGGEYWKQFMERFPKDEQMAARLLHQYDFDRAAAAAEAERQIKFYDGLASSTAYSGSRRNFEMQKGWAEGAAELLKGDKPLGPRTYEVQFNARPEQLLDWDAPVAGQPAMPALQAAAKPFGFDFNKGADWGQTWGEGNSGADLYTSLMRHGKYFANAPDPKAWASQVLNEGGIPGIRYADQGSRDYHLRPQYERELQRGLDAKAAGETRIDSTNIDDYITLHRNIIAGLPQNPTFNYVAFDPSKLDIMAKYGVVGGVPLGMGALAAQDQYGAQQ